MMEISLVFINSFSKTVSEQKFVILKTDSITSSAGQGKLTYFMHFPWPPLEA
jgi:hypothetical protein